MEQLKEVKVYSVDYKCDKCETGYLRPTGMTFLTHPPQYPHICNTPECDGRETFDFRYPTVRYEEVKNGLEKKEDV